MGRPPTPLEERFWEKVDVRGPGECWPWTASTRGFGYGQIAAGAPSRKILEAHRVSWEIHNGPIPVGEGHHGTCVLHTCDNPPCVNPQHLFLGTFTDNMQDRDEKGRTRGGKLAGEEHGRAKLTGEQVFEIRQTYVKRSRTYGTYALARKYGVCNTTIGRIVNGKHWRV